MTAKTLPELSPRVNTLFDLLSPVYGLPGASGAILEAIEPEPAAPDPSGSYWLAFTGDHDEGDAAATFRRRYGQPPRYAFDGLGGLLLVGPVPGQEGGA
jgi:hypothetical protein